MSFYSNRTRLTRMYSGGRRTFIHAAAIMGIAATALYYAVNGKDDRPTTNTTPSVEVRSQNEFAIRHADEITIDEKMKIFGKHYDIYVGNEKVAEVTGKSANWWNDRFILKTVDGKILETETENKRMGQWNRSAEFFDGDGKVNGYISEDVFKDFLSMSHIIHIYDKNGTEVGVTKKKPFTWLDRIELYDAQGNVDYLMTQDAIRFLAGDIYKIKVLDRHSAIPVEKAIFLTCIEDAIKDAESSDSSSSDDD